MVAYSTPSVIKVLLPESATTTEHENLIMQNYRTIKRPLHLVSVRSSSSDKMST
jgi:hypothetical protein